MATSTGKKVRKTYFRAAEGAEKVRQHGAGVLEAWRGGKNEGKGGRWRGALQQKLEDNRSELSSRAQGGAVGSVMEGE